MNVKDGLRRPCMDMSRHFDVVFNVHVLKLNQSISPNKSPKIRILPNVSIKSIVVSQ